MINHTSDRRRRFALVFFGAVPAAMGGCAERVTGPRFIQNRMLGPMSIAVAPALNLSGCADFDPERFADVMAGELTYVDGVDVIPVSRVLGALSALGLKGVESATDAWELRELLGADAILVFAVTEYDPYDPPSIGIDAQLYGRTRDAGRHGLDPVAVSRHASFAASEHAPARREPLAQAQRVFDAGHDDVARAVEVFAQTRGGEGNPFGWRKYVVSQRDYIRFCCHETLEMLMRPDDRGSAAAIAEQ